MWTYLSLIKTAWIYISSGALRDVMKLRKGPVIAALYPVGFLIAQLGFAILCAAVLSSVVWSVHPVLGIVSWGITWPILALFQKYDGKIFAHYLMQDYADTARHKGAYDPELSTRLDAFGHSIEEALGDGYDEVLVVGHSSGAHLGVSVLARLERAGVVTPKSPISFFSLGHVVPMVSFLPAATELRSDLKQLGNSDAVTWVDVTWSAGMEAKMGRWSFPRPLPKPCQMPVGGRCGGGFSVCIFSTCAPLTNLGFMITFRSRQGHIHCAIVFRDAPHHHRASWRRPRDMGVAMTPVKPPARRDKTCLWNDAGLSS